MTAAELLADCQARETVLTAQGARLEIDAPETELTPDLLARLQAHKPQLLEILTPEATTTGCEPPTPAPQDECPADLQPQADAPADLAAEWVERTGPDGRAIIERTDAGPGWDEAIDPPAVSILRWAGTVANNGWQLAVPQMRSAADRQRIEIDLRARYAGFRAGESRQGTGRVGAVGNRAVFYVA